MTEVAAELVHGVPGRLRMRVPAFREDPQLARALRERLAAIPLVSSVELNAACGSVLLRYDTRTPQQAVEAELHHVFARVEPSEPAASAAGGTLLEELLGRTSRGELAQAIATQFDRWNAATRAATGGIDLKVAVPILLFVLALLGLLLATARRGKIAMPSWYDLLWFAFNTFVILNLTRTEETGRPRAD